MCPGMVKLQDIHCLKQLLLSQVNRRGDAEGQLSETGHRRNLANGGRHSSPSRAVVLEPAVARRAEPAARPACFPQPRADSHANYSDFNGRGKGRESVGRYHAKDSCLWIKDSYLWIRGEWFHQSKKGHHQHCVRGQLNIIFGM